MDLNTWNAHIRIAMVEFLFWVVLQMMIDLGRAISGVIDY